MTVPYEELFIQIQHCKAMPLAYGFLDCTKNTRDLL